ncbi:MAG: Hsp70 family protein [Syntrophomonadaceae bacterium]|nr:Hsp70 family protein [Syntrophomonadaceae bacterium]
MNLAIDFGTSFTKIGYMLEDNFINLTGKTGVPTVFAYIPEFDKLVFGHNALQINHKDVYLFPAFKLELKRNPQFRIGSYNLYDILFDYFSFLKREYIDPNQLTPRTVSICVPNYFGLNARQLLIQALNHVFLDTKIYLVPEPVAALAGYTMVNKYHDLDGDILVVDIGGGTTDFSFLTISRDTQEIIIESQLQMGQDVFSGTELDKAILNKLLIPVIAQQTGLNFLENTDDFKYRYIYKNLLKLAEHAKIEVNEKGYAYINEPDLNRGFSLITEITSDQVLKVVRPFFEKLKVYLEQHLKNKAQNLGIFDYKGWKLDHVILLGGASQTRGIYEFFTEYFSPITITWALDKTLNVVKGLAIWPEIIHTPVNIKTIYPFNFYIQKYDTVTNSYILEPVGFDTSLLELDIRGKYKVLSLPVDSPYNLSTEKDLVKFLLYEVEEEVTEISIDRFMGQEIVLNLELSNDDSYDYIDIELDLYNSQLTALYPKDNSNIELNLDTLTFNWDRNDDWLNLINESLKANLRMDLQKFLDNIDIKSELLLEDQLQLARFKLLVLLHNIS